MKKLMQIVVIVLLLCVPVRARDFTAWIWNANDATGVRFGTIIKEELVAELSSRDANDVEIGFSALWLPDRGEPEIFGVYAIYHLPDIVQIPNPIALDFLPEILKGRPYLGGEVSVYGRGDFSLIAGITFEKVLFFEYREGGEIIAGLTAKFRF